MNSQELNGKSLALLLAGEDEDWSVLRGTVRQQGDVVLLDHSAGGEPFHIQPEWLDRISETHHDTLKLSRNETPSDWTEGVTSRSHHINLIFQSSPDQDIRSSASFLPSDS